MKKFISQNIGFKLLSVLLALLLWLTVMNVEDPAVTQTISDVPVQIINDEVIKSRGYGYTIESGEKIDIKIKGRRSVVDSITADDFTAIADFSSFSSMKMVPIEVTCTSGHAGDLTWTARTDSMAIILEAEQTASKSIRIEKVGDVKEGYYLYDYTTNTSLVTVKGAESQVAKVKEVVAEVNIEGLKDSDDFEVELYAVDSEGEKIDPKKITLLPETIMVHFTIYPIKAIPLNVIAQGTPALYHYLGETEFAPQEILITAEENVLKNLEKFDIMVNISGAVYDIERQINLEEYLEEFYKDINFKLVDQTNTMGIKIHVLAMEEKVFDIEPSLVLVTGKNEEKYTYEVRANENSKITIKGRPEKMANIEAADFELHVDASGLEPSVYTLDLISDYQGDLVVWTGKIDLVVGEVYIPPEITPSPLPDIDQNYEEGENPEVGDNPEGSNLNEPADMTGGGVNDLDGYTGSGQQETGDEPAKAPSEE